MRTTVARNVTLDKNIDKRDNYLINCETVPQLADNLNENPPLLLKLQAFADFFLKMHDFVEKILKL